MIASVMLKICLFRDGVRKLNEKVGIIKDRRRSSWDGKVDSLAVCLFYSTLGGGGNEGHNVTGM